MRRESRPHRASWGMIILLVALLGVCSSNTTLSDRVYAFVEAHNSYRVEDVLASVTSDAAFENPNALPIQGLDALADWIRWDSITATQWQAVSLRVVNDSVVEGRLTEVSTWLQLLGVGLLEYETVRFVFQDTLVSAIALGPPTGEARERLDRGLADFEAWAQHEFPERLARIRSDGRFVTQPRRAADWIALVREWQRGER